jgi:hypothetical protein
MTKPWFAIAKAEFLVLSSSMKGRRVLTLGSIIVLGVIWAAWLAPMMMGGFLLTIFSQGELEGLMSVMMPGLLRTVMMFVWFMLLLFPMSYSLQEIKIGQWEIMLSNNVRTRDILSGQYIGRTMLYGLVVLFLAPLLVSPFAMVLNISLLGQIAIYGVMILMALSTIWTSNWLTSMIQARLGDSSKGNDIAKAIAMIVAIIVILPMYGLMMFAPAMSEILGLDVFLLAPFTWFADLTSQIVVATNGLGWTASNFIGFTGLLSLDLLQSSLIVGVFILGIVGLGLGTADRIFTIEAGVRTESVTTVGNENHLYRGIRRVAPGSFGALLVSNMKDFLRKAQNLSKIGYGIVLASILPFFMSQMGSFDEGFTDVLFIVGMLLSICGVFPFVGQGFLESKDQLWILQSTPDGASRFVKSRLVMAFMVCVPLTIVPVAVMTFLFSLTLPELLLLFVFGYIAECGAAMIAVGITARNPAYEDSKSPAHQANIMSAMLLAQFSSLALFLTLVILDIALHIDFFTIIGGLVGEANVMFAVGFMGIGFMTLLGATLSYSGIRSLSQPE